MNLLLRCALLLWLAPLAAGAAQPIESYLLTKAGRFPVSLEIADTNATREQGLMHRTSLPESTGMLFLFDAPQTVRMWMKNTPLSLDMLFLDAEGTVMFIEPRTVPNSLRVIGPNAPVAAVLEVPAGTAERMQATVGDRLVHPRLGAPQNKKQGAAPAPRPDDSAITYTRGTLVVHVSNPPEETGNPQVAFDADIRSASSASAPGGWYRLTAPGAFHAVVLTYATPSTAPLEPTTDYAPIDTVWIDAYGRITQILPNTAPASLEAPIASDAPVVARMHVEGGTCAKLGIRPGDTVEHAMFKQKPAVLRAVGQNDER